MFAIRSISGAPVRCRAVGRPGLPTSILLLLVLLLGRRAASALDLAVLQLLRAAPARGNPRRLLARPPAVASVAMLLRMLLPATPLAVRAVRAHRGCRQLILAVSIVRHVPVVKHVCCCS